MPSQLGQDLLVLQLLDGKRGGFFLDSGAADGVSASNTLLLEVQCGWTGICVEPDAAFFERLVTNRRSHCVNCCLYDREEEVRFVEASTLGGIRSEYEPALLNHAKTVFRLPVDAAGEPVTVIKTARTVRSVLREFRAPRVIDYWSSRYRGLGTHYLEKFPVRRVRLPRLDGRTQSLPCAGGDQGLLGEPWVSEVCGDRD